MRVLLVEDDSATAMAVELMLRSEGFNVFTTDLGEEGAELAKTYDYDAVLLDLNLPDMNGLDVLRRVRAAKIATPVIIVTGDTRIDTKVKAFTAGADDYMTKPFHRVELVARIHAVIRRACGLPSSTIEALGMVINVVGKTVTVSGEQLHLTGTEYRMLELLAMRRGATITKEMLMNHLYGGRDEPELKIIDVYVCKLRRKFESAGLGRVIETIWGRGYQIPPAAVTA